jgi:hypothetical protein
VKEDPTDSELEAWEVTLNTNVPIKTSDQKRLLLAFLRYKASDRAYLPRAKGWMRQVLETREQLETLRKQKDAAYLERNQCVALLAKLAHRLGWDVGVGRHPDTDAEWGNEWRNILFIELPTGQVSWHFHDSNMELLEGLPRYQKPWDGHDTPAKYRRVNSVRLWSEP